MAIKKKWIRIRALQFMRLTEELGWKRDEDAEKLTLVNPNGVCWRVHLAGGIKLRKVESERKQNANSRTDVER